MCSFPGFLLSAFLLKLFSIHAMFFKHTVLNFDAQKPPAAHGVKPEASRSAGIGEISQPTRSCILQQARIDSPGMNLIAH